MSDGVIESNVADVGGIGLDGLRDSKDETLRAGVERLLSRVGVFDLRMSTDPRRRRLD
jgi:hypothetical protein